LHTVDTDVCKCGHMFAGTDAFVSVSACGSTRRAFLTKEERHHDKRASLERFAGLFEDRSQAAMMRSQYDSKLR
jgi:hypothetical protein